MTVDRRVIAVREREARRERVEVMRVGSPTQSVDHCPSLSRQEVVQAHLDRMEVNARHLYEHGDLREGVSLAEARDIMWVYSSPELYELLVLRQHWPLERYGQFVAESLVAALLPPTGKG